MDFFSTFVLEQKNNTVRCHPYSPELLAYQRDRGLDQCYFFRFEKTFTYVRKFFPPPENQYFLLLCLVFSPRSGKILPFYGIKLIFEQFPTRFQRFQEKKSSHAGLRNANECKEKNKSLHIFVKNITLIHNDPQNFFW